MTAQEFALIRQSLRGDGSEEMSQPQCARIERLFSAQEFALIRQLLRGIHMGVQGGTRVSKFHYENKHFGKSSVTTSTVERFKFQKTTLHAVARNKHSRKKQFRSICHGACVLLFALAMTVSEMTLNMIGC